MKMKIMPANQNRRVCSVKEQTQQGKKVMDWSTPLTIPEHNSKKIYHDQCGEWCVSGAFKKQLKKLLYLSEACVYQSEHRVYIMNLTDALVTA